MGVLGIHLTSRGARAVLVASDGEVLNAASIHSADLRDALSSAAREAADGRSYELVGLAADPAEAIDVAGMARIVGDARIEKAFLVSAGASAVAAKEWVGAAGVHVTPSASGLETALQSALPDSRPSRSEVQMRQHLRWVSFSSEARDLLLCFSLRRRRRIQRVQPFRRRGRNSGAAQPVYTAMAFILRAGTAVLAGAISTGCVVSVDSQGQIVREEKRFSLDGTPELHLATFDGSIQIQSWDKPEVVIEIEKRGATREAVDTLLIESSQKGNRIDLEVKAPRRETFSGFGFNVSTSAKLVVSMPRRADIVARTGDGSINVDRLEGRLELRTGDGAIRASEVLGDLIFDTGDGSITVDHAEGKLTLETGDGGVNVSGKLSAVRMHTGDGAIVYRVEPGASMSDDWDISTGDGSVSLYLPTSFGAEIDAHTGDGSIRTDLTLASTASASDGEESKRTLKGRLGDGGRRLKIRTGDGSIVLKER